jgi:hypothetical protein
MIEVVSWLKGQGVRLAILSDQTNWLDELEEKMGIFPSLTMSSTAITWKVQEGHNHIHRCAEDHWREPRRGALR